MPTVLSTLPVRQRIDVLHVAQSFGFAENELETPMTLEGFRVRLGVHRNTALQWSMRGVRGIKFRPLVIGNRRRYTLLQYILWQMDIDAARQKAKERPERLKEQMKQKEKSHKAAMDYLRRHHPSMLPKEEQPCPTAK